VAVLRARVKTLQPNSIATIEQEGFLSRDDRRGPAHDGPTARRRARQHGLQVSVPEPPRWLEIIAVRGHGRDAPEPWPAQTSSAHTNLHAVISAGGAVPFARREIARDWRILGRQDGGIPHGGLHLQRSVRRMADIACDIGESEGNALSGWESIFCGVTDYIAFCEKGLLRRKREAVDGVSDETEPPGIGLDVHHASDVLPRQAVDELPDGFQAGAPQRFGPIRIRHDRRLGVGGKPGYSRSGHPTCRLRQRAALCSRSVPATSGTDRRKRRQGGLLVGHGILQLRKLSRHVVELIDVAPPQGRAQERNGQGYARDDPSPWDRRPWLRSSRRRRREGLEQQRPYLSGNTVGLGIDAGHQCPTQLRELLT